MNVLPLVSITILLCTIVNIYSQNVGNMSIVQVLLLAPRNYTRYSKLTKWLRLKQTYPLITRLPNILKRHHKLSIKINITKINSNCSKMDTVTKIADFIKHSAITPNVFIGPTCNSAVFYLAPLSAAWKIPIVTVGATSSVYDIDRLINYKYLIRTGATSIGIAKAVAIVCKKMKWTNIGLVQKTVADEYRDISHALGVVAAIENWASYTVIKVEPPTNHTKTLVELSLKTRVILLAVPRSTVRGIMLAASKLNYDRGDFAFIYLDLFTQIKTKKMWHRKTASNESNASAKRSFEALLSISLKHPPDYSYPMFVRFLKRTQRRKLTINRLSAALFDSLFLYINAYKEVSDAGLDTKNTDDIIQRMRNRSFQGESGLFRMDVKGDRIFDYTLFDINPETGNFENVGHVNLTTQKLEMRPKYNFYWPGGHPPPDTPKCGFDGSKCSTKGLVLIILAVLAVAVVFIITIILTFIYGYTKFQRSFQKKQWKIRLDELMLKGELEKSDYSLSLRDIVNEFTSEDTRDKKLTPRVLTVYYRGNLVAVKKCKVKVFAINQRSVREMKILKELHHDHICQLVGVCLESINFLVYEYCLKGSLREVLENPTVKLDWMMRYSLMHDLARGMEFLHKYGICHGNLRSSNCLVDSRFVVKISGFGLHSLFANQSSALSSYTKKITVAPELLRMSNRPKHGTQKGDVYSFALICHEIICRKGVFFTFYAYKPLEIYELIIVKCEPPLRPTLTKGDTPTEYLDNMVRRCWSEEPPDRPEFSWIKAILRKLNSEWSKGTIIDNLLYRMERYANNLEVLVKQRTDDYLEQKRKVESLLYMILPRKVAASLIEGDIVEAEAFSCVTIYFSDIVGFTTLAANSTPMQVIDLLKGLYDTFDKITERFDVYKVETIGDAYMVASGLPVRNGYLHAPEICKMSLALLSAVIDFKIKHLPSEKVKLRIGVYSGPVVAGVVGSTMPRYCLLGDTVNTAAALESHGLPLKIHVGSPTKLILDTCGGFTVEERGFIEVKGRGSMITYWLTQQSGTDTDAVMDEEESVYFTPDSSGHDFQKLNMTRKSTKKRIKTVSQPTKRSSIGEFGRYGLGEVKEEQDIKMTNMQDMFKRSYVKKSKKGTKLKKRWLISMLSKREKNEFDFFERLGSPDKLQKKVRKSQKRDMRSFKRSMKASTVSPSQITLFH